MTVRFSLITLGIPELSRTGDDGARVRVTAVQRKHLAALAFIAFGPNRSASRQVLASYLWSDNRDGDALHGLRTSLALLRSPRALGPDALSAGDKESITLLADVDIDAQQFERLVAEGRFADAIHIYRGAFFAEWASPGAEGFEDWVAGKRVHFLSLFVAASAGFINDRLQSGQASQAVKAAERLLTACPASSEAWKLLLESRLAARDRVHALADAQRLELLANSREIEIDETLARLIRRVQRGGSEPSRNSTAELAPLHPEMVAREREFSRLIEAWSRADGGRFTHIHIEAPAGLGKSRLLDEFGARLRSLTNRVPIVVTLRGDIVHRQIDYAGVARIASALGKLSGAGAVSTACAEVLVGLEPSLAARFTVARALHPPIHDAIRVRVGALRELVTMIAEERRLVILIDDLQWMDTVSQRVIAAALADLRAAPVLLVTAARPMDDRALPCDDTVTLGRLPKDAIGALCQSIAELDEEIPWATELTERLHKATKGSPFLALHMLAHALDAGVLSIVDNKWACAQPARVSEIVDDSNVVAQRIASLTEQERFALLLTALAPESVTDDDVAAMLAPKNIDSEVILALERRGLLERRRGSIGAAHDEFMVDLERSCGPAIVRSAHHLIASAIEARSDTEPDLIRDIALHYRAADELGEVQRLFRRFVESSRREGDVRSVPVLAKEFLGGESSEFTRQLASAVPAGLRYPRAIRFTAIGVAIAAMLTLGILGVSGPVQLPATIHGWVFLHNERGEVAAERIDIRPELFGSAPPIRLGNRLVRLDTILRYRDGVAVNPVNPNMWVTSAGVADSGVTELFLIEHGRARRLTFARGDDVNPTWSPDGRYIAFASGRWNPDRWTGIAIMDTRDHSIRQLTSGSQSIDRDPAWSPDGTRIAYNKRMYNEDIGRVCVTAVERDQPSCTELGDEALGNGPPRWLNDHEVAVRVNTQRAGGRVAIIRPDGVSLRNSDPAYRLGGTIPPAGLTFYRPDTNRRKIRLALATEPERGTTVEATGGWMIDDNVEIWVDASARSYLDSVTIVSDAVVAAGVPHQLRALGFDNSGRAIVLNALRWSAPDSLSGCAISPNGVLKAVAGKSCDVQVSAGGWRSTRSTFAATTIVDSVLVNESWNSAPWNRWTRFGIPEPEIDSTTPLPSLNINGEGTFFSGVYSSRFEWRRGLAIEAEVSAPITRGQWQEIIVGMAESPNESVIRAWDHKTGYPPIVSPANCVFQFPAGPEGKHRAERMQVDGVDFVKSNPAWRGGRPFRVRLQLLPDGRCATMVDGRTIGVGAVRAQTAAQWRFFIYGNTLGTKIRVGRVELLSGVKSGLDMSKIR